MDNGNGSHAANSNGHANGHVKPLRPIYYRAFGGGVCVRFSPSSRFPRCPCRETFAYPNDLVLSIDDECRQLVVTNGTLLQEIEELTAMVNAQGTRIIELKGTVVDDRTRADAASVELQRTRVRLTRVVEEVQNRAAGILPDTTMLIEEVIEAVDSPAREGTLEEKPFEENPDEEVLPDGPTEN